MHVHTDGSHSELTVAPGPARTGPGCSPQDSAAHVHEAEANGLQLIQAATSVMTRQQEIKPTQQSLLFLFILQGTPHNYTPKQ